LRSSTFCIALIVATIACAARAQARPAAPPIDLPPAGIVPTQTTLAGVLRYHDATMAPASEAASRETWTLDEAGRPGTETIVRRGADYHSIFERSGAHEEYGKLGADAWHLDANGVVTSTTGDEDSFYMQRVLEDASDPKNDVKLLGTVTTPAAAYVVQVDVPQSDHPEWIFFDRTTGYVIRTERIIGRERIISTYDDYRITDGSARPWHVVDTYAKSGISDSYRLSERVTGDSAPDAEFRAPASAFRAGHAVTADVLPSTFVSLLTIVRVTVNGRGLDFILSTADDTSFIDRQVAIDLGLPTFGHAVKTADGKPVGFDTVLEDAAVGSLKLHNFALRAIDFVYAPSEDTKIVGCLGSDFLNSGVFTIDYMKKRISVAPSGAPAPLSRDEYELPVHFEDGVPNITTTIGKHETPYALVSTALSYTAVLGSFTRKFPEAVPEEDGRAHQSVDLPFADNKSYGRTADLWESKLPSFVLPGLRLVDYRVAATDFYAGNTKDVLVGADFLSYFDVTLDYANRRIVLHKNDKFYASFRTEKR
jgi:hypothetical protein